MNSHKKTTIFLLIVFVIAVGGLRSLDSLSQTMPLPKGADTMLMIEDATLPPGKLSWLAEVEYQVLSADLSGYFSPDLPFPKFREDKGNGKAWLYINAIYAIDKDRIFVGGSLVFSNSGDAQRSVLLRSLDGGKHWKEVMQTANVSEVKHIIFLDQGKGWALVHGSGELGSRMPTVLWHTENFGETWNITGKVDNIGAYSLRYMMLRFYDSKHGEVSFVCDAGNLCGGNNYFSIQTTEDNGVTWQENYRLALPFIEGDPSYEKRLAAFIMPKGGFYGSHVGNCFYNNIQECPSYGQDGSEWQAEYSQDEMSLFIRKRLLLENQWTTYEIPACIEYRQGEMMEPCKESK